MLRRLSRTLSEKVGVIAGAGRKSNGPVDKDLVALLRYQEQRVSAPAGTGYRPAGTLLNYLRSACQHHGIFFLCEEKFFKLSEVSIMECNGQWEWTTPIGLVECVRCGRIAGDTDPVVSSVPHEHQVW
jgi:hypothetical protein